VFTVLDGAMGTELGRRGVSLAGEAWSARANLDSPDVVRTIHAEHARAGATVHTANTFRTTPWGFGPGWEEAARRAVALAREAVPAGHRVAASLAPLRDCYRPDLSPASPRPETRRILQILASTAPDLLLCEAFPHVPEAWVAVEEAAATGLPVWVSFTAGPHADLLTPAQVRAGVRGAVERGAAAVCVNCIPADRTGVFVDALADAGVPFGAYANAETGVDPDAYAAFAATWVDAGATLVGGCCGTRPDHVRALARLAQAETPPR
jgi:S-methylmethionine-dependent homocysteine/selenocysteine methylase